VSIFQGSILDVDCDAVVSFGNSFGFMNDGMDALYLLRFGAALQDRLQDRIRLHHHGELIVGSADSLETFDDHCPYLIAAPIMRVPAILEDTSLNPYLAARAALLLTKHGSFEDDSPISEKIRRVAFLLSWVKEFLPMCVPDKCEPLWTLLWA
jgi:O-acetyl-ADP-ribose deacetylase (regulator of RNase III)